MAAHRPEDQPAFARRLRREITVAETMLWRTFATAVLRYSNDLAIGSPDVPMRRLQTAMEGRACSSDLHFAKVG